MSTEQDVPRRRQMNLWTPAERAIYDAMQAVERAGASPQLTTAVVHLGAAFELVADHVDAKLQQDDRDFDADFAAQE